MKKRHLIYSLILTVVFTLLLSMQAYSVSAASKPAARKKNVTLYTDSKAYTIQFKNVSEDAKIKYTSSDKTVVKIKNSKVVPKNPGTATVTAKITQNGKTYKVKVKFTVLEALPDYDALATSRIKELKASGETIKANVRFQEELLTTKEALANYIYEMSMSYSTYGFYIDNIKLLRSEEEYMDMFPAISSLKFYDATFYNNAICIMVDSDSPWLSFPDEYAIDCAILTGDSSKLSSSEKKLYKALNTIVSECKGKNEYQTVKNIHEYLILNIAYSSNLTAPGIHTLYNAIYTGSCVCDGYAKGFYFLCRVAGIDCRYVIGSATNSSGTTESHAWNKVNIDGKWYSVDVTWDDPYPDQPGEVHNTYFLITDKDISSNHTWDDTDLPDATSDDLGYIYTRLSDTVIFDSGEDLLRYIADCVEENYSSSFKVELKLIDSTYSNTLIDSVKSLLAEYHSNMKCGYSLVPEMLPGYGRLYEITVYRG